ncbi:MAG: hypothetical protein KAI47_03395 [Deltaproteobacteria bacterium]|nr:hypothetical protein [Deltaproteobacteria bacterium]
MALGIGLVGLVGLGCPASQKSRNLGAGGRGPIERIGVSRQAGLVKGHPRLWITAADLPRLRGWAVSSNPFWKDGLQVAAAAAKQQMDDGTVPGGDSGQSGATDHPTEMVAEMFAFMSLVHPDKTARADYAKRARTLLMVVMNEAAKGVGGGRFRAKDFSTYDRSRWQGEAFPLIVDWIYPTLTAADKVTIRKVFERWVDENMNANTTGFNHPTPVGATNDSALVKDKIAVRWSANNYYTSHMRNLGLMGLALDPKDDVNGKLKKGFESAVGAFLYVNDALRRGDSRGGLSPEGPYYAPESVSYVTQLLLALYTSGHDDVAVYGRQAAIAQSTYWDDIFTGWFHLYPPTPRVVHDWQGPLWEAAWSGDGSVRSIRDAIDLWGPLGIYHYNKGNRTRLDQVRWIQENFPTGGKAKLLERAARSERMVDAILYFLLYGPGYKSPKDPRPIYPKTYLAAGIGHLFGRTGWDDKASFFRFICGYNSIDHQHSDGNHFGFWRKGEWLTRDRTGYAATNPQSQFHNTLSILNDPPSTSEDWVKTMAQSGSQWMGIPAGDGKILRNSAGSIFVYALGDTTALYNSTEAKAMDVRHASRSIVWLKPDHVVFFDRAETAKAGRFKRLWQQLPSKGTVSGQRVAAKTPKGQEVFLTTLLPKNAKINVQVGGGEPADELIMTHRVSVEAPTTQKREHFLHVFQGADSGAKADVATLVEATAGGYLGAFVKETVVMFPDTLGASPSLLSYTVPSSVKQHLITGLTHQGAYTMKTTPTGATVVVEISPGGPLKADDAGVLTYPPVASEPHADGGLPPVSYDGGGGDLHPWPGLEASDPAGDGPAGESGSSGGCVIAVGPNAPGVVSGDVASISAVLLGLFWLSRRRA